VRAPRLAREPDIAKVMLARLAAIAMHGRTDHWQRCERHDNRRTFAHYWAEQ
jgi:hypothetical protein